jgi:hypothetical protein
MRIAFSFRFGATVGEEERVDIARRDLRQLRTQARAHFGRHERVCVRERLRLVLDRVDDTLVAVTDVDAHQLAVEIDEALAFRRPEVDAFGTRDRNRIDSRLYGPFKQRVFAAEFDDLLARQVFSCGAHRAGCYSKSRVMTNTPARSSRGFLLYCAAVFRY